MKNHHAISCYDKNLCLKPNLEIWLSLLFLLGPYLVLILSIVNLKDKTGLIDMVYASRQAMTLSALAGVPATFLAYAWTKRKLGASPFVRKIWRKGRTLLAVSALLNAFAVFAPFWLKIAHKITLVNWIQLAIALLIVVVVYTSSYMRDCFNDFPSDEK